MLQYNIIDKGEEKCNYESRDVKHKGNSVNDVRETLTLFGIYMKSYIYTVRIISLILFSISTRVTVILNSRFYTHEKCFFEISTSCEIHFRNINSEGHA
jgi:hypothetical protein